MSTWVSRAISKSEASTPCSASSITCFRFRLGGKLLQALAGSQSGHPPSKVADLPPGMWPIRVNGPHRLNQRSFLGSSISFWQLRLGFKKHSAKTAKLAWEVLRRYNCFHHARQRSGFAGGFERGAMPCCHTAGYQGKRESSLLTTYWSESILSSR